MGNNYVKQFKGRRKERGQEKDNEEPEEFLNCLLIENWELTKAAFDKLEEEKQKRFTQFLDNPDCMDTNIMTELEVNALSKSMKAETVKAIKQLLDEEEQKNE